MNQNHKAFQLWKNGQLNEAVQLLFEEIENNNENSDSYCNLASIFILAKKYEDAQVVLETALEKEPNHVELLYTFGNLYYQKNNPTKALIYFNQVLNGNGNSFKNDAVVMIGQCYLLLNEPKRALAYLLTAHEKNEKDSSILTLLGDCMMQINHFKQARQYYTKAYDLSPDNDEILFKRGLVGAALKEKPEKFNLFFEKAKTINPENYQKRLQKLKEIEVFMSSQQNNTKPLRGNEVNERRDG